MFSLQKFFGKDPQFFDLLEQLADEVKKGTQALNQLILTPTAPASTHALLDARKKTRQIHDQISELVVVTFVTTLEKEDIKAMSDALYRVLKPIEKFVERLNVSKELIKGVDFSKQASVIQKAVDIVVELVGEVRKSGNLERVKTLTSRMHQTESEADALELDLLKDLYQNSANEAVKLFIGKDLYDLLERATDRCRDVGNVVMNIALKNS